MSIFQLIIYGAQDIPLENVRLFRYNQLPLETIEVQPSTPDRQEPDKENAYKKRKYNENLDELNYKKFKYN